MPEIDAVYAWADSSDSEFSTSLQERKRSYLAATGRAPEPESVAARRFRGADNLRYSLRSLEKNAPWFRRIFIVTNGQAPKWFRPGGRAQIVTVDEIFPDRRDLPTFNATAIEWNIHRIAGLGRYYIFMNDDYFFTQPTAPEYFFGQNGLPKLLFSPFLLDPKPVNRALWKRLLAHQAELLDTRFGKREWRETAHGPFIFDNLELARIREFWPQQIRQTAAHPFREETDAHMQIMYANTLSFLDETKTKSDRHEPAIVHESDLHFVSVGHPDVKWHSQLKKIRKKPPRFICLNDDCPDEGFETVASIQRELLDQLFPDPSSFEEAASRPTTISSEVR